MECKPTPHQSSWLNKLNNNLNTKPIGIRFSIAKTPRLLARSFIIIFLQLHSMLSNIDQKQKGVYMKFLTLIWMVLAMGSVHAADKMKMHFNNEDLIKVIESYSKASGQKFVIDHGVRGRITIFIQEPISIEESFNQLSSALAINGYAISKQGDTMIIKSARNIQRDLIEVSTERPSLKPERMYTWIYNVKNVPAGNINRDLRILPSKDGEMSVNTNSNQIVITDRTSNLNRIAHIMKEVDKPLDPATAKIVEASRKSEAETRRKESTNKKDKTEN